MNELMLSQGSLRELAGETGGIASVNTNSLTNAFAQIVQANSRYYVLGYYPPTHSRDGRFHKIEVRDEASRTSKSPRARVTVRPAGGPPKSGSATKRRGARARQSARTRTRRRPSFATC